jgi:hypothetical protein
MVVVEAVEVCGVLVVLSQGQGQGQGRASKCSHGDRPSYATVLELIDEGTRGVVYNHFLIAPLV